MFGVKAPAAMEEGGVEEEDCAPPAATGTSWFSRASTVAKALTLPLRVPGSAMKVSLRRAYTGAGPVRDRPVEASRRMRTRRP